MRALIFVLAVPLIATALPAASLLAEPTIATCDQFSCVSLEWRSFCPSVCVHVLEGHHARAPEAPPIIDDGLGELFLDGRRVAFCGIDFETGENECGTREIFLDLSTMPECHVAAASTLFSLIEGGLTDEVRQEAMRGCD